MNLSFLPRPAVEPAPGAPAISAKALSITCQER